MTTMNGKVDELVAAYQAWLRENNPGARNEAAIAGDAQQALGRGEDLIARRGDFTYNGVRLQAGDYARVGDGKYDFQLIEQGYFVSEAFYKQSRKYQDAEKLYKEQIRPEYEKYCKARDLKAGHQKAARQEGKVMKESERCLLELLQPA